MQRLRLILKAELDRRKLLRGGALLTLGLAAPGCGATNEGLFAPAPAGTTDLGSTSGGTTATETASTGNTASSSSGSTAGSTGSDSTGSTASTASASGSSGTSSGASGTSSSGGSSGIMGCIPTCTADAETLTVPISAIPVGGGVVIHDSRFTDARCEAMGVARHGVAVVQPTAGSFLAFSTACTHACTDVVLPPSLESFVCPAHGSRYNLQGQVTHGPSTTPLARLSIICVDNCSVYVKLD